MAHLKASPTKYSATTTYFEYKLRISKRNLRCLKKVLPSLSQLNLHYKNVFFFMQMFPVLLISYVYIYTILNISMYGTE